MDEKAMLVILENGNIETHHINEKKEWTVGRKNDNVNADITISSPIAGRLHGRFIKFGQEWFYTDNGSINGTYYNGKKIKNGINGSITPIILGEGDILRIDSGKFENPDPRGVLMFFTKSKTDTEWKKYNISNKRSIIVGSDLKKCDIILAGVSPRQLIIKPKKTEMNLSICNNSIEIFVNNKPVLENMVLREKDVIRIKDKYLIYSKGSILFNT